ncbi:hypothetical protein N7527_008433 [Penicillium freii]|nr:hypothetical protein N7527_008433 [Penicillium freii]
MIWDLQSQQNLVNVLEAILAPPSLIPSPSLSLSLSISIILIKQPHSVIMSDSLDLDQIWNWNAEVPETVSGCVHDLIATIALHHPDSLAVCAWDGDLTYSQLNLLSRRLAHRLLALRIPRQSSIPLLFSKSRWTCVAMLAVIQAGYAAIALDATQPDTRLRSIVHQTKAKVVISSPVHATRAAGLVDASIVQLDETLFDDEVEESTDELPVTSPSDIVYISFTSDANPDRGTTGQPKGACISHANVGSAAHHQGKKLGFHSRSRVFDFAPYSFDVAWSNFLHTLCAGGCICIANEQDMLNDLSAAITAFKATLINVTPTVLRTISPIPHTLETVLLSGEMPYRDNITRWAGKVHLLNTYGPTECTFKCSFSLLRPDLEGQAATLCGVEAGDVEDIYPCTALQQGMLAISARDASADYTSRTVFDLPEDIDMSQLDRAWTDTVAATPILRTRVIELPGEGLVQVVVKIPVRLVRYEYIRDFTNTATQPLHLGRPLCRAGIIAKERCRLALELHHSIYDGWTTMLILDTFEMAYRATEAPLPPLSFQPFVKHVMAMETPKATEFWRDQLVGCDATVFPSSKYNSKNKLDFNHVITGVQWPRTGTTPSSVVRSALAILLASYTNTDDVKYGATVSGRQAPVPDIERIAGPTIATVPVRVKLNWDQTVDNLLQQVQRQMVETTEYEQFGLQRIQRIDEDTKAASQFELLLIVQPAHQGDSQKAGGLFSQAYTVSTPGSLEADSHGDPVLVAKDGETDSMGIYNSYAMMIICQLEESGAELKINFDSGAIEEDEVQRLAGQFEHLLRQLCSEKFGQFKLGDVSPLTGEDLVDIWGWNRDLPPAATECVLSSIAQRAATRPGEIAICAWDNELTYQQLQEKSIVLACRMREHGVTPGSIIVLNFEKSSWLAITMIAVLQLGCIALPVSVPTSSKRASQIVDDLQPELVITSTASQSCPFTGMAHVVTTDGLIGSQRTAFRWSEYVDVVYNWYGPAEACVATSCRFDPNNWQSGIIGTSQSACTWLVDPKNPQVLAPVGAIAELCIEGPIVASYTGKSGVTLNEKQLITPLWLQQGHWKVPGRDRLLYRTGDLVKYTLDGSLLFLGRAQDSQRKLRGQRVDLGDIERLVQGFLNGGSDIKTSTNSKRI